MSDADLDKIFVFDGVGNLTGSWGNRAASGMSWTTHAVCKLGPREIFMLPITIILPSSGSLPREICFSRLIWEITEDPAMSMKIKVAVREILESGRTG